MIEVTYSGLTTCVNGHFLCTPEPKRPEYILLNFLRKKEILGYSYTCANRIQSVSVPKISVTWPCK